MRVVVQKVKSARCIVNDVVVSVITNGLMLLVAFTHDDDIAKVHKMANKIANLRIFEDENQKLNLAIKDVKGAILSISQFTLYADTKSGHRPSFTQSMKYDDAKALYLAFNQCLNEVHAIKTLPGSYGEHMILDVLCDGPVTICLEN